ncbi:carbohydrate-binding protein [Clostridium sp. YIM B02551]|uniref:carbohydrate-binding protein n=1 Tax=Clostridium sp. YIM B02551 TaxID=2910679 RepID=UPI001EE9B741|nr:carbohydrate-binding protein [Clostridium sp. YIM B02551]
MFKNKFLKKVISVIVVTGVMVTGVSLNGATKASAITTNKPPSHVIVGYWHNFNNGSGDLKLRDVSNNFDVINISFGEPTSVTSGDIRFTPYNATEAEFKSDVQYLQSKGKKVLLSIGGQNGEVQLTTTAAVDTFYNSVGAIIDKYGLDGLDVDFEGHSLHLDYGDKDFKNPTTPVIVNTISALKKLKAKYGENFMLTMAPETFFVQLGHTYYGGLNQYVDNRAGAFLPVIYGLRDSLTWLQVQYYNSGPINDINGKSQSMGSAEFYASLADMLLTGFTINNDSNYFFPALRQDQVVIGVPSCNSAGGGYVSNAELQKALDGLIYSGTVGSYKINNRYPNLRGLMTWSINWDKYTNYDWSNYFRSYINKLTPPTNTLSPAVVSASSVTNRNYTVSALISAYNTATSYKIYEGTAIVASGNLTPGSQAQTINYNVTSKALGTYNYKAELSDGSKTVVSNTVTVTVSDSVPSAEWAPNHAYTAGDIVTYNGATYKCLQSHTSLVGWEPDKVAALWQKQ